MERAQQHGGATAAAWSHAGYRALRRRELLEMRTLQAEATDRDLHDILRRRADRLADELRRAEVIYR